MPAHVALPPECSGLLAMVVMAGMATRHRLGIKHALLLRAELRIKGPDCLRALDHPGVTLV